MKLRVDIFNSEIFEVKMANIVLDEEAAYSFDDVQTILQEASKEGVRILSVKINTADKPKTNCFLSSGFELVDTQIMYCINTDFGNNCMRSARVRKFVDSDKSRIMEIAGTVFRIDQFHSNPYLDNKKCDLYYEKWSKNLCEGLADAVYVIEDKGLVLGFISLKYDGSKATVGLAAIDAKHHSKGLFSELLLSVINELNKNGIEKLYYGTQLANLPVLKTMAKLRGIPVYSNHVMHKMLQHKKC